MSLQVTKALNFPCGTSVQTTVKQASESTDQAIDHSGTAQWGVAQLPHTFVVPYILPSFSLIVSCWSVLPPHPLTWHPSCEPMEAHNVLHTIDGMVPHQLLWSNFLPVFWYEPIHCWMRYIPYPQYVFYEYNLEKLKASEVPKETEKASEMLKRIV